MKLNYFDQEVADQSDWKLQAAIAQGYVPATCLLSGAVVMSEVFAGRDACYGCNCDRSKCHGRKRDASQTSSV